MKRVLLALLFGIPVLLVAALGALWLALPGIELAPYAGPRLRQALGRDLAIASLRVRPGARFSVSVAGVTLANRAGGSPGPMVALGSAEISFDPRALLRLPAAAPAVHVVGLQIMLERDAKGVGNWQFDGGGAAAGAAAPAEGAAAKAAADGAAAKPVLHIDARADELPQIRLEGGELRLRSSSGKWLRVGLTQAVIAPLSEGADLPARLSVTASGAYNGIKLTLAGVVRPPLAAKPDELPADLTLRSGSTAVQFTGSFGDLLNADLAVGRLTLNAPRPGELCQAAGSGCAGAPAVQLSAAVTRRDPLWTFRSLSGRVGEVVVAPSSLDFREGGRGEADRISGSLTLGTLDLNRLLGPGGAAPAAAVADNAARPGKAAGKTGGKDRGKAASKDRGKAGPVGARLALGLSGTDLPLIVPAQPLLPADLRVSAQSVIYRNLLLSPASVHAVIAPGRVALPSIAVGYLGGQFQGAVEAVAAPGLGPRGETGARLSATLRAQGIDVVQVARLAGAARLPLSGRLDLAAALSAPGVTLNDAARLAHVSVAVTLNGGSIARRALELVSVDLRSLFRRAEGVSPVSCALLIADLQSGVGRVSPLRLRAQGGTFGASGGFDLNRGTLDLVAGTQPRSTGNLALDVPVRVSGDMADPTIRPARWSGEGRAMLSARDQAAGLLPVVRDFARASRCYQPDTGVLR